MMDADVLAQELLNMMPVATEAEAIVNFANAYAVFAADAEAGGVFITALAISSGKLAMQAALVGMNVPGTGATKLFNGVVAFWSTVAAGLAASFPGVTAIVPPPHAGLVVALVAQFLVNTDNDVTQEVAMQSIASIFYAQATAGGTVTFPPSTVVPIQ